MTTKYMIAMLNRKLRVKLMQTYTARPVPPASNWVMKFSSNKTRLKKLSTAFNPNPFKVVSKTGNSLVVESPTGNQYSRNTGHVK